jgi:cyclopropane-fatty-acyl-phospholipid synthase
MSVREMIPADLLPVETSARGALGWAERGWLPDALVRHGIRRLCARRLKDERRGGPEVQQERYQERLLQLRASAIAIHTRAANSQHYELPVRFFESCLGRHLKYSCAYFASGTESLDVAEAAMLGLYTKRAELADGQEILELGCGWGSLTLWMADHYPNARITAVSNSGSQREHIEAQCRARGHRNVQVITADVNHLQLGQRRFDRCVSVEMFEHVRNYRELLARIASWLQPEGKLFVHIFAHRTLLYPFEVEGEDNWLGRNFFTGGLMPATDTLQWFQDDLRIERSWLVEGTHYQRTAEAWLANHDSHRERVLGVLREAYGAEAALLWNQRWRMFWMSCAELFGYAQGSEWMVAHYRFQRRR